MAWSIKNSWSRSMFYTVYAGNNDFINVLYSICWKLTFSKLYSLCSKLQLYKCFIQSKLETMTL